MTMSMLLNSRKTFLLTLDPLKQISADLNRANDNNNNNNNNNNYNNYNNNNKTIKNIIIKKNYCHYINGNNNDL